MARRKSAWQAEKDFNGNMLARTAIYMLQHPGWHIQQDLRRELSASYDNKVKHCCRRLAMMGYVQLRAGYVNGGKWGRQLDVEFTDDPRGLQDNQLVVAYSSTTKLYDDYHSGELKRCLVDKRRAAQAVPVNDRIIRGLISLHPESIDLTGLKAAAGISEGCGALARRLEALVEADWVVLQNIKRPGWSGANPYMYSRLWKVQLSAGGWLRVQRAKQDVTQLNIPKPRKKKKKEKKSVKV